MKINRIFLTAITATVLLAGCSEDRLIEMPVDQFPIENAITDASSMRSVLNGVYDHFSGAGAFGADILIFGDLISDNVFITAANTDVAYRNTGNLNWSSDISDFGMLGPLYDGIVLANTVINNTSVEETQTVLNYKGEAKITRAIAYLYLLNYYSPNPTSGMNQEFGVPLNLGAYDPNAQLPRATVAEVYQQVIDDLTSALQMMTNEDPVNKGYLNPTAARLLLSRAYLTRGQAGDYQKSVEYADQVINSAGSSTFDFVDRAGYVQYFTGMNVEQSENQPETVWEINMNATPSENTGVNSSLSAFYESTGSKKRFMFTQEFRNTFPTTDIRRSLFNTAGTFAQDEPRGVWTRKWIRLTSEGNFTQNVKVLRMSEVKLNKVEALAKMGNEAAALALLNEFATERGGTTYTSASIDNILTERRKEFFAEGHRFFDLKRNNLGFERTSNCYSLVCSVPANDKIFVIPMPLSEMNVNLNMVQYPGW